MNKPYIKKRDVIVEIISYVLLLVAIIYGIVMACTIDGEVPTHWDLTGEVDGYGSPVNMLVLPLIMFFTNLIVSACIHLLPADKMNMPCKPKPGRELIILNDMVWMMVWIQFVIGLFTMIMTIGFFNFTVAIGSCVWMVILCFVFVFAGYFRTIKHNK